MSVVHISTNMLVRVNAIKSYSVTYMPRMNNSISWQRSHRSNCASDRNFTNQSISGSLQWRHDERDGVSNHQPYACLLNCLFRCRSKNTSKIRVTGLCEGNSPGTGEFPAQMASNVENVSIWWRHDETVIELSPVLVIIRMIQTFVAWIIIYIPQHQ